MFQYLRKSDIHSTAYLPYLCKADAPVDDGSTVRANRYQVSELICDWLIFHHVCGRTFGGTAANAVDFPRLARSFVFRPTGLKECRKVNTQNQYGTLIIACGKPALDPSAHCVFMNCEQIGDFFHRVAAMNFHEAVVRMSFPHHSPPHS
jgi:hypothetical protein